MSKLAQYEIDDPTFVEDLKNSNEHVAKVAAWLRSKGLDARVMPLRIRENVEDMSQFSDNGDIFIGKTRIEAKQRMLCFQSKTSFPYRTIIVDVCHTWDQADPKPFAYILTNAQTTCCLVVKGSTSQYWQKVEKWDRTKKRYRKFYECPIEHCEFYRMVIEG